MNLIIQLFIIIGYLYNSTIITFNENYVLSIHLLLFIKCLHLKLFAHKMAIFTFLDLFNIIHM